VFGAFGELLGATPVISSSAPTVDYAFAGREFDRESGIYDNRARKYDQSVGRFITIDPIFPKSGLNGYEAFRNNPLIYVDPDGFDAIVYITPPPLLHAVIGVTDPKSPTGTTYFDYGPRPGTGLGIGSPVPGQVNTWTDYPTPLIPIKHYPLTSTQDQKLIDRANTIKNLPSDLYPYTPLPGVTDLPFLPGSHPGKNCFGFTSDVCGGTCK
jgi:RHS repeat-associated protein